ncbi:uncharacterized protein LOC110887596 [Helianthus annuus]|uniref:uncharacterized protein LOC110887596 n=1 Tax=Helianthus annuus TaxID=4232 RepID=UPI000B9038AB|nr:uncharacterized protein LOC110887596 [Helianthus annuus]
MSNSKYRPGQQKYTAVHKKLAKRNVQVGSLTCPVCEWCAESTEHVFTGCSLAVEVWAAVGQWCRLSPVLAFGVKELLEIFKEAAGSKWGKNIIHGIIMVSCWCIWLARNEKIFQDKVISGRVVMANIKRLSVFWLNHRSKYKELSWDSWIKYPLYVM